MSSFCFTNNNNNDAKSEQETCVTIKERAEKKTNFMKDMKNSCKKRLQEEEERGKKENL